MTESERMQSILLTHDQIEEIASRAADKAIECITQQVYQQVLSVFSLRHLIRVA